MPAETTAQEKQAPKAAQPKKVEAAKSTVLPDSEKADQAAIADAFKGQLEKDLAKAAGEDPEHDPDFDEAEEKDPQTAVETEEAPKTVEPGDETVLTEEEQAALDAEEAEKAGEETESEENEENEEEQSERKDWPKSAVKRVGKLTAKLHKLEARLAELEDGDGDEAEASGQRPDATTRITETDGVEEQYTGVIAHKRAIIDWAKQNPEGGEVPDGKGGVLKVSAEQAQAASEVAAEELLEAKMELKAYRRQQDQLTREATQQAVAEYPWLADKTSKDYAAAQNVLRKYPFLKKIPQHVQFLAEVMEFQKVKAARKLAAAARVKLAEAAKTTVKKPLLSTAAKPRNGAPATNGKARPAMDKFLESGSSEDAKAAVESWLSN